MGRAQRTVPIISDAVMLKFSQAFDNAKTDALALGVDVFDIHFEQIAEPEELSDIAVIAPGDLCDVDQPYDPRINLYKGAVALNTDDLALDDLTAMVALLDGCVPRIRRHSLEV
jgi:hypothetical protein